jgi:3-oxoacyl-[acyl-carrier protein] reductase
MHDSVKLETVGQLTSPRFADLSGRRAVVTGASRGIGRAIALEFARAGADVVIHSKSASSEALAVCEECRRSGNRAEALSQDFSGGCDWSAFVDRAWQLWGGIDLWINNAGADLLTTPAADRSFAERLNILFEVDVRSTLLLSKEVGRRMREAGRGVIINIGWDQADRGMAGDSGELFAASKSAIMGFTRSLAVSLAPAVRVNCIAPGWIRTAWGEQASQAWQQRVVRETPLARWGTPEDIAWLARFLASDQAAYITGQIINANGGAIR